MFVKQAQGEGIGLGVYVLDPLHVKRRIFIVVGVSPGALRTSKSGFSRWGEDGVVLVSGLASIQGKKTILQMGPIS